ncbi:hypothetical protein [Clostridium thermobutyricum]|uniref:hypothetical protein n=1 Tax=Clostridium thermobutyricum TaxID=29372 RepID=UPI0018AB5489|nr:hypothetical protein [Clostridium thermobutyricum]
MNRQFNFNILDGHNIEPFEDEILNQSSLREVHYSISIQLFKIKYSYLTKRKNMKERIIKIKAFDKKAAVIQFFKFIQIENEDKPHRAISNVKILGINSCGYEVISV